MEIEIRYIGKTNWEGLKTDEVLRVEKGATVADLLTRLKVLEPFQVFMVPIVNGEHRDLAYIFQENDELEFYTPVSGG